VNKKARVRAMPCSRIFGALIFVAVAIVAAPTYVASQPRTDKVEKDEAAAPPMDDVGGPKTTAVLKEYQSTKLEIAR
jgi:flagellin-like protein